jgi:hypothetical protein
LDPLGTAYEQDAVEVVVHGSPDVGHGAPAIAAAARLAVVAKAVDEGHADDSYSCLIEHFRKQ